LAAAGRTGVKQAHLFTKTHDLLAWLLVTRARFSAIIDAAPEASPNKGAASRYLDAAPLFNSNAHIRRPA
jgi:hypothetical protein